jgi:hypothetical protein
MIMQKKACVDTSHLAVRNLEKIVNLERAAIQGVEVNQLQKIEVPIFRYVISKNNSSNGPND